MAKNYGALSSRGGKPTRSLRNLEITVTDARPLSGIEFKGSNNGGGMDEAVKMITEIGNENKSLIGKEESGHEPAKPKVAGSGMCKMPTVIRPCKSSDNMLKMTDNLPTTAAPTLANMGAAVVNPGFRLESGKSRAAPRPPMEAGRGQVQGQKRAPPPRPATRPWESEMSGDARPLSMGWVNWARSNGDLDLMQFDPIFNQTESSTSFNWSSGGEKASGSRPYGGLDLEKELAAVFQRRTLDGPTGTTNGSGSGVQGNSSIATLQLWEGNGGVQRQQVVAPTPLTAPPVQARARSRAPQPPIAQQVNSTEPHAVALHDYESDQPEDVPFKVGDTIRLTREINADWLRGRNTRTNREGIFPRQYVDIRIPLETPRDSTVQRRRTSLPKSPSGEVSSHSPPTPVVKPRHSIPCLDHEGTPPPVQPRRTTQSPRQEPAPTPQIKPSVSPINNLVDSKPVTVVAPAIPLREKPAPLALQKTQPAADGFVARMSRQLDQQQVLQRYQSPEFKITQQKLGDEAPARAPTQEGFGAVATATFRTETPGDLEFEEGDTVLVLGRVDANWWMGRKETDAESTVGIFPAEFVRLLSSQSTPSESASPLSPPPPSYPPPPPPRPVDKLAEKQWFIALHDFEEETPADLTVKKGALLRKIDEIDASWFLAECVSGGAHRGQLPRNFVRPATEAEVAQLRPQALALFDFSGEQADDLSFKTGDTIYLIKSIGADWLMGEVKSPGTSHQGMFPSSFVRIIVPL